MLKLAQLKYPSFPVKVNPGQATVSLGSPTRDGVTESGQFMYRETCYFSSNYEEDLRSLGDPLKMAEATQVVQFPFTQPVS